MNKARSIKQNARPDGLPNFRNLGTLLRILIICNGLALLQAILQASSWTDVAQRLTQIATLLAPVLLTGLLLLWIAQAWLPRLSYLRGVLVVNALVVALTLSIYLFGREIYNPDIYNPSGGNDRYFDVVRYGLLSVVVCNILLIYFKLRSKVLSRALNDARLQVLRARIRPHFLFNTINAVLGIVRTQPKQAETALEDMADLFRMAMSEGEDLVLLGREIQLSKQYLALEQLRMEGRLQVKWEIRDMPEDVLIPPLLLQPLLENAVYHGIEQLTQGGSIRIELRRNDDEIYLKVENPCPERAVARKPESSLSTFVLGKSARAHRGNRVALRNIRERLDLLFDVEARYQVESGKDFYRVEIFFPYVPKVKEQTT